MKSKFAKFTDCTLGAALVFFAATAVLRYYTTLELAMVCATAITACALLLLKTRERTGAEKQRLSAAAEAMFFDFMFMSDAAPARLLHSGLKARGNAAVMHGGGVYLGETAAFCVFDGAVNAEKSARLVAKAKRFGAKRVVILCKSSPTSTVNVDGFTVTTVCGDDVYRLFASLDCLPEKKFTAAKKSRLAAFSGALDGNKILKYILLAATFYVFAMFTRSLITFVCACACALLAIASIVFCVLKRVRSRAQSR
ncbi:MAG: hypothetical protein NC184_06710 [Roseburia sp.]|nr:hypothetical protein [Roseburia sp.]